MDYLYKDAYISTDGNYRYTLKRMFEQGERKPALWIMLNPSTADAFEDDATIRRCVNFSKSWGCSGITVVNLYAYRSKNPRDLLSCEDAVGAENDEILKSCIDEHSIIICGWGNNAKKDRVAYVVSMLESSGAELKCLGVTKSGMPKHPLYIKSSQEPMEFNYL